MKVKMKKGRDYLQFLQMGWLAERLWALASSRGTAWEQTRHFKQLL